MLSPIPARHDHTPAYTAALGLPQGESVTLRVWTGLPVTGVSLKVVRVGEIEYLPAEAVTLPNWSGEGQWFEARLPIHAGRVRYAWELRLPDDHLNLTAAGLTHGRRGFRSWFQYLAGHIAPEWAWQSVFYQIFPDRFRDGDSSNNVREGEYQYQGRPIETRPWGAPIDQAGDVHAHYGGDLRGIQDALPYLTDLGVNALWLTPIFVSPSNHRYDISDYRHVDPHLGGDAAFDDLIGAVHAANLKIVLDGVFNHVGNEHALFQAALAGAERERAMFTWRDEQEKTQHELPYHAFFDVPTLPKLDYLSGDAEQEFLAGEQSVVRQWLRRGADGWRLDVAHMIGKGGTDEGNLDLHRSLKRAARAEKRDAYVFGERFFDPEAALDGSGEDGAMNYHGFGLPLMQWFSGHSYTFTPSRLGGEELCALLADTYHALPPQVALSMFNLLDSHDIPRALFRLGGDTRKLRAALTLLLAYAGVPCLYYGTEIGLSQAQEGAMPWCRESMPWNEAEWDTELRAEVQQLIKVRRNALALQQGHLRFVLQTPDAVGFVREYTAGSGHAERVLALASRTPEAIMLTLPQGDWTDLLSGEVLRGQVSLDLSTGRLLGQGQAD
ncbi:glycoside hydrolase family 13 protein [Deinococcus psychrotolerans]|uniref:Glycoside hydrolase family 13 protein n=1 Tax=Deinococcus psychrotolerans TaxID=2489213 RepID=A0A3G8YBA3_9DEIO|nr:alpha-amylase family glycosyl hydrolase [Deinococcus psychrotolerans]AZI42210.1 glycoside hydrolase family 13 protein [Deinococcus psychrotolerans]